MQIPNSKSELKPSILAEHSTAIRALGKQTVENIIEIGRRLTLCKEMVGHGNWLPWLDHEFGWSADTAERFIQVHTLSDQIPQVAEFTLPISGLYLLAAPSTPEPAKTEILERAAAGEDLPIAEVKRVVKKHKASKPAKKKPEPQTAQMKARATYIENPGVTAKELKKLADVGIADARAAIKKVDADKAYAAEEEAERAARAALIADLIKAGLAERLLKILHLDFYDFEQDLTAALKPAEPAQGNDADPETSAKVMMAAHAKNDDAAAANKPNSPPSSPSSPSPKRGRGRPKGSKNKPKAAANDKPAAPADDGVPQFLIDAAKQRAAARDRVSS